MWCEKVFFHTTFFKFSLCGCEKIMDKVKLIACDMDGTLLNSKSQISQRTLQSLNKASENGIEIVICTGRTSTEITKYTKQLKNAKYAICTNGAFIIDLKSNKRIFEDQLPLKEALKIIELTKNYDVSLEFFNENGAFLEKYAFDNLKEYHLEKFTDLLHATCTPIENLKEYIVKLGASVDKINIFCKNTDEKDKIINICKDNLNAKVTFSLEYNAEINSPTASKGNALKNLCKQLNIKSSEVIAFGDSSNDISMLKFAKYSFAMGNSIDEVKKIAFKTVATNDEDGIVIGLEMFNTTSENYT